MTVFLGPGGGSNKKKKGPEDTVDTLRGERRETFNKQLCEKWEVAKIKNIVV